MVLILYATSTFWRIKGCSCNVAICRSVFHIKAGQRRYKSYIVQGLFIFLLFNACPKALLPPQIPSGVMVLILFACESVTYKVPSLCRIVIPKQNLNDEVAFFPSRDPNLELPAKLVTYPITGEGGVSVGRGIKS